ncbi:MAG: D-ribose pyranase [Oscillospiraceae bacterium]
MKKNELLNDRVSAVIATMGHKETLAVGDCGLPVPKETERIDLALKKGIPTFIDTLCTVLGELCVEKVILAEEIKTHSPRLLAEIEKAIGKIPVEYVAHEKLKEMTKVSKAVIRTGECTSYANIILVSGVTF